VVDARVLPEATLDVPALGLRDYQSVAVEKLARVTQGTVVIPCGGGKTRVGMGAIAKLRTPTLILVHTLDLAEQWLGELKDKLGLDAGLIGDGEERSAPVTVAVIQALVRWEPAKLDAFLGGFGLLILDEAHHVAASTFHSVVDRCPARYRLGLTPTPPPDKPEPVRRPAKVARQLALAHHLQAAIERGLVADQAALARKLGLTRARVTQLFDLLMLAADLQEQVLALEAVDGAEPMAERTLRAVARAGTWAEQRAAWTTITSSACSVVHRP
jgi:superfamily II DNA or RNA helicase